MKKKKIDKIMVAFTITWFMLCGLFVLIILSFSQNGKVEQHNYIGAPGKEGDSAYKVWLDQGNVGTEKEFLESIKGKDGETKVVHEQKVIHENTETTIVKEVPIEQPAPEVIHGKDGKTPEFRTNPSTCNTEWRYQGDDNWRVLIRINPSVILCGVAR